MAKNSGQLAHERSEVELRAAQELCQERLVETAASESREQALLSEQQQLQHQPHVAQRCANGLRTGWHLHADRRGCCCVHPWRFHCCLCPGGGAQRRHWQTFLAMAVSCEEVCEFSWNVPPCDGYPQQHPPSVHRGG